MWWLALHLPALSLEAWQATLGPAAAAAPLALQEQHRLLAVNRPAAALGVAAGMKRATALALAPGLVLGAADAARDAQALQAVAHVLLAFTPSVAIAGPASLVAEAHASLRYFGGRERLLQRLRRSLQPLGLTAHLAEAPTAAGALLLARSVGAAPAPAMQPPTGTDTGMCTGADASAADLPALQALLAPLPAALLVPDAAGSLALQQMGLHTLADLRRQPRAGLARRFGAALLGGLDRAWGDAPEAFVWVEPSATFEARLDLGDRAEQHAPLLAAAWLLLAQLVGWARARRGRVVRFRLALSHERRLHTDAAAARTTTLEIALAQPSADAAHLQGVLHERLARLPLAGAVVSVRLSCTALVSGGEPDGELFPSTSRQQEDLLRLIERLQARLGADAVRQLEVRPDPAQTPAYRTDHRPEAAQRTQAAGAQRRPRQTARSGTGNVSKSTRAPKAPNTPSGLDAAAAGPAVPADERQTRPIWLLAEPRALPERAAQPWLDGQPLRLLSGPERIESGWWDAEEGVARDYFIAQTQDGALVWVFHLRQAVARAVVQTTAKTVPTAAVAASESGWFLHGRFG